MVLLLQKGGEVEKHFAKLTLYIWGTTTIKTFPLYNLPPGQRESMFDIKEF